MIFRNMYSGTSEYNYLEENLYLVGDGTNSNNSENPFIGFIPYDEFALLRRDLYRQDTTFNGTLGNYTPTTTYITGSFDHQAITPIEAPYQNWNLYLSYVYDKDENYPMKYTLSGNTFYSFTSGDGIPFRVSTTGNYYTLTSPVEHGFNSGEYIILSGGTIDNNLDIINRVYYVDSIGNETFNSEKYVITSVFGVKILTK